MQFSNFQYTKKDGETKNYLILKMEDGVKYVEGIVLTKLESKEIEDLVEKYFKYEVKNKEIENVAADQEITVEDFLSDHREVKEEYDELYNNIKPYIKKAYRKFLTQNIVKSPEISEDEKEAIRESINADSSADKE